MHRFLVQTQYTTQNLHRSAQTIRPHPYLPRAVTLDQLEVLAQVVVGAEAHFEDLGGPPITGEVRLGVGLCDTLSWTGHLPRQGFAEHLLVHRHGWVGTIISTPFLRETERQKGFSHGLVKRQTELRKSNAQTAKKETCA